MTGQTVSHYRIVEELGRGGMGAVYRAQDLRLHRDVALKFLRSEVPQDARVFRRFQAEARLASGLNHPHICTIHDVDEHEGHPFIVMELLQGSTLGMHLQQGPLSPRRVLELGIQLADALAAAHAKGIIHRDVKPANVFLTAEGSAKLLDFGIAKLQMEPSGVTTSVAGLATALSGDPGDGLTLPGEAVGTLAYMSPEQVNQGELDARTDLFSLGAVLYEAATGHRAFGATSTAAILDAILHESPTSPARINPQVPTRLEEIITRALEKDRNLRYQSAADLRADLKLLQRDLEAARALTPSVTPGAPTRLPPERLPSRRWGLPVGAAMLLAAAGFLGWRFMPGSSSPLVKVTPLTTDGGFKYFPSLSPDGQMIAYVRLDLAGDTCGTILVRPLGAGTKPLCLTGRAEVDAVPSLVT